MVFHVAVGLAIHYQPTNDMSESMCISCWLIITFHILKYTVLLPSWSTKCVYSIHQVAGVMSQTAVMYGCGVPSQPCAEARYSFVWSSTHC